MPCFQMSLYNVFAILVLYYYGGTMYIVELFNVKMFAIHAESYFSCLNGLGY